MNTFKYSIVICTRGGTKGVVRTIESAAGQDFDRDRYEIIVVDNNEKEKIRAEVESAAARHSDCVIRYVLETEAGLHSARHRGAFEAKGDIVSYLDDDVTTERSWLRGVAEIFEGTDAVLVGGKVLPVYEVEVPAWLSSFVKPVPEGWYLWQLSLVDFGDEIRQIDPCYVFGCNYSIRKDVLFECGGFHPDSLPVDMISYRGDGETALSEAINEKGLKAFYSPKVCVYHHIPKERLTVEYFCKRMFSQGISDSYAKIRKEEGIRDPILLAAEDAYHKGRAFHHEQVMAHRSDSHKLFIFFGTDIEVYGHKILQESHSHGYTLLPLDSSAIGFVRGAKLPFVLIDEYVGLDALVRSRRETVELYRDWFKAAASEFILEGVCWPEFDSEAMRWFWRDVAMTFELAETFQSRGGSQLRFFHHEVLRPSVYYYHSDICAVILNQLFPAKARPISISNAKDSKTIDYFSRMRITFDDPSGRPLCDPAIFKDRIVLAFNPGESYRFGHVIEQLTRDWPGEVAAALIFPNGACAEELSQKYSIPVISPRRLDFIEPEYQNHFINAYNKLAENSTGRLGWTINVLKHHFANYCRYRWPAFVSNLATWSNFWQRTRPIAALTSSLCDGESQLPVEAANRYDIPTVAIPHGASFDVCHSAAPISKYMLYSLAHQKTRLVDKGVLSDRLLPCRSLRAINEHPVVVRESFGEKKKWRILALLNPTKIGSAMAPNIEPGGQLEALQILNDPPADIDEQVSLSIKLHPGYPEFELVSSVSSSLTKKILPPDTELQTVVDQADLVIAVNYFGAALAQVVCSDKPIIFLTTDRLLNMIQSVDPDHNIYLFPSKFHTVSTQNELWDAVRKYFTDEKTAQEMRLLSKKFFQDNLDDSKYPTIGQVMKNILSQKTVSGSEKVQLQVNNSGVAVRKCKIEQLLPGCKTIPVDLFNYKYQPGIDGDGSTPPHELEAICKIVKYKRPHTIFEFGTYEGDTTLRLAVNSNAEIYTSDLPPKGHKDYIKPLEDDPELDIYPGTPGIKFHDTPWANRIHQILADTQTYDFSQFYGKFDVVFVDAWHHYKFVLHDSINALKMIRPGGVIIWHDYADYAPGVMQALNEINSKFPLLHIEGTSLAVYYSQGHVKSEDVETILFGNEKQTLCKSGNVQIEEDQIKYSVIIPTYNRQVSLERTIESLVNQDFQASQYEILIIDNGSTDSTAQVAESAILAYQGHNIRYIYEPEPGMLSGRHKGALEAKGEILVFVDDDIKAVKGWLSAIARAFNDESVHLVGGASLPEFEAEPPSWMEHYWSREKDRITCSSLSLIVLNTNVDVEIDPIYVWGLNFSIRKKTLFELGGFHPDCIPKSLQHFQGDGETGLASKLKAKGYKAIYAPGAIVYHCIPKKRLTVDYFKNRFFYQGVCDSYTQIRRNRSLRNIRIPEYKKEHPNLQNLPPQQKQRETIYREVHNELVNGFRFHLESVSKSPKLLEWVLREDYFDYKLPQLQTAPAVQTYNLPSAGQLSSSVGFIQTESSQNRQNKMHSRLKVAILADNVASFTKIQAEGLQRMFEQINVHTKIFYDGRAAIRQNSNIEKQLFLLEELRDFDLVVVAVNMPCAFLKETINDKALRQYLPETPIVLYDNKYLGTNSGLARYLKEGSPEHGIMEGGHLGLERYDWHLVGSVATFAPMLPSGAHPYSHVGINLNDGSLFPEQKEFIALIDFERPYPQERRIQIQACEETNTKYIILKSNYSIDEIRRIYRRCSIYFIAHPESFGLPICELQACGSYIFTPYSIWCRAHWLKDDVTSDGDGSLSPNFSVYDNDKDKLKRAIQYVKRIYDPRKVVDTFLKFHSQLFYGDLNELRKFVNMVDSGIIHSRLHSRHPDLEAHVKSLDEFEQTKKASDNLKEKQNAFAVLGK